MPATTTPRAAVLYDIDSGYLQVWGQYRTLVEVATPVRRRG
jgi:hypothetical protein